MCPKRGRTRTKTKTRQYNAYDTPVEIPSCKHVKMKYPKEVWNVAKS